MKQTIVNETVDRYRIRRENGTEFDVPKRGLSPALEAKVRGYAKGGEVHRHCIHAYAPGGVVPGFARGGDVRRGAFGGPTDGATNHHSSCIAHGGSEPCNHPNCCAGGRGKWAGVRTDGQPAADFSMKKAGPGYAEGGDVPDAGPEDLDTPAGREWLQSPAGQAWANQPAEEASPAPVVVNVNQAPQAQMLPSHAQGLPPELLAPPRPQVQSTNDLPPRQFTPLPPGAGQPQYGPPEAPPDAQPQQQQPAPIQRTTPLAPFQVGGGAGPAGGTVGELNKGIEEEKQARLVQANEQARQANAMALQQDADRKAMEARIAAAEEVRRQRQAKGDELFQKYQDAKVDPNSYWNSKSTGNKIGSAIAIIIGGYGMGLAGQAGKNPAMDVINKAIDRDIESQRFNIQKQGSAVRFYMDQTHDLIQAQQLAKADALDVAAARLKSMAAGYQGVNIQQQAAVDAGAARKQAVDLRQQVAARGLQMQGEQQRQAIAATEFPLQLRQLGQQVQMGELQLGQAQFWDAQRRGVGPNLNPGSPWAGTGVQTTPMGIAVGPTVQPPVSADEHNKRLVQVQPGRLAYANSDEDATQLKQALPALDRAADLVAQMKALGPKAAIPGTDAYIRLKGLQGELSIATEKGLAGRVNNATVAMQREFLGGSGLARLWYGDAAYQGYLDLMKSERKAQIRAHTGIELGNAPGQGPVRTAPY